MTTQTICDKCKKKVDTKDSLYIKLEWIAALPQFDEIWVIQHICQSCAKELGKWIRNE